MGCTGVPASIAAPARFRSACINRINTASSLWPFGLISVGTRCPGLPGTPATSGVAPVQVSRAVAPALSAVAEGGDTEGPVEATWQAVSRQAIGKQAIGRQANRRQAIGRQANRRQANRSRLDRTNELAVRFTCMPGDVPWVGLSRKVDWIKSAPAYTGFSSRSRS